MSIFGGLKSQISVFRNKVDTKSLVSLILIFGFLKGIAFIAPLLLSEICNDPAVYGEFEYGLNLGMTLMGIIAMGLPGAYAYFVLKNERNEMIPYFHLHFVALAVLFLSTILIFPNLIHNNYFGAALVGFVVANQVTVAAILKVKGKNNLSILVDTGLYLILAAIVAYLYFSGAAFTKSLWYTTLLVIILCFTLFYHLKKCIGLRKIKGRIFGEIYRFGILIVIASPLVFLITNNTRIYIEYFLDLEEVGYYSFYFRIASVLLLVSRVIQVLLFRRIFISEHHKLDRYLTFIMYGLAGLMLLAFGLYYSPLSNYFFERFATYAPYAAIFPLCFFQILFWINASFFEGILVREKLMKQFILLLGILFVIMISVLSLINEFGTLNLTGIIIINTWTVFALFLGQQIILGKNEIRYGKSIRAHLIFGTLYVVFLTFIH